MLWKVNVIKFVVNLAQLHYHILMINNVYLLVFNQKNLLQMKQKNVQTVVRMKHHIFIMIYSAQNTVNHYIMKYKKINIIVQNHAKI